MTFWSRSRQEYWRKGTPLGNIQLFCGAAWTATATRSSLEVDQIGPARHTGTRTCFDADDLDAVPGPPTR